ncbi:MAG: hypothetical protein Fur0035_08050 [Anaerolineales bacterium]
MRLPLSLRAAWQLGFWPAALNGLYKLGLAAGVFPVRAPAPADAALQPIFPPPVISDDPLPEVGEILSGRVRLFGAEAVPLRLAPSAPLRPWTAYESLPADGDIKAIWEPARFAFVFPLGRAFLKTGDPRFAAAFWRYFEEFEAANPPYFGENWMSGQEAGLRLMAFCWAGQIFAPAAAESTPQRLKRLSESVAAHAQRIPPTLLYARAQNNNHLLTEAAALYTAARALPAHPRAAQWRRLGKNWLAWCFSHQFDAEGEYIQHSSNYQRLALRTAQWIFEIAAGEFDAFLPTLQKAARWLAARTDPLSGRACNLGANDGANIFPVSSAPGWDFRPLFQPGQPIRAGLEKAPAWHHLRVKRYFNRPSHADHLHLDLWLNGLNLALDPGTFSYNAAPPWDNGLTTALVHNTLTVDGRDQMTRAGRFLYLDWGISRWLDENSAESEAYARLGLLHRRKIESLPAGWRVRDEALFTRPGPVRKLRLHWLLADLPWKFSALENGAALILRAAFGEVKIRLESDFPAQLSLFRAGESLLAAAPADPIRGWASPLYGQRLPALSLALEVESAQTTHFVTTIEGNDE